MTPGPQPGPGPQRQPCHGQRTVAASDRTPQGSAVSEKTTPVNGANQTLPAAARTPQYQGGKGWLGPREAPAPFGATRGWLLSRTTCSGTPRPAAVRTCPSEPATAPPARTVEAARVPRAASPRCRSGRSAPRPGPAVAPRPRSRGGRVPRASCPTRRVAARRVDEYGAGDSGGSADREAADTAAGAQDESTVLHEQPGGVAPFQAGAARGGRSEGGFGDHRAAPA